MAIKLPEVPRLKKFCFCMDVPTGVKASSFVFIVLWSIYIPAILLVGGGGFFNKFLSCLWAVLHILAYAYAIYGQMKSKAGFLKWALINLVLFVFLDIIQGIVEFILLDWFAGAWCLALAALSIYYIIGLKNVYDDMVASGLPSTGGLPSWLASFGGLPGTAAPVLDMPETAGGPGTDPEAPQNVV
jgi:hypothetical protein